MPRTFARAAVMAAAVLACAACSEGSPGSSDAGARPAQSSEPAKPSATPADGPRLEGAGYAYRVPKDWGPSDQEIPGFDPDTFALDLDDDDGFTDNVNVLLAPGGAMSAEQAEVGAKDELTSAGATGVAVQDRVDVGGREAAHVSAGMSLNDNDYQVEQFYAATDDETFVVTFSFSKDVSDSERAEVTGSVLASWSWAG